MGIKRWRPPCALFFLERMHQLADAQPIEVIDGLTQKVAATCQGY